MAAAMPIADQPAAVADLTGLGIALAPAELLGAVAHALDQLAGRIGLAALGVLVRFVADAQLDRIEAEPLGQLVHRRLQAHHARGFARRPHGAGDRDVEQLQPVAGEPVGGGVEGAREGGGALDEGGVARAVGGRHQRQRGQPAVRRGAEADALDGGRAVDGGVEHLLAGERDLHRLAQRPRRQRRRRQVLVAGALAAETAADIERHQVDVAAMDLQRLGDQVLRPLDHLHRGVDHHLAVLPPGRGGAGLHLAVVLDRGGIDLVELHRRLAEGELELADRRVGVVLGGAGLGGVEDVLGLEVLAIAHLDQGGGGGGVLEAVGDHHRDRLAEIADLGVDEHRVGDGLGLDIGLGARLALARRRVEGVPDQLDAGRGGGGHVVHRGDLAAADLSGDEDAIGRRRRGLHLIGVGRRARDLQRPLVAVYRPADDAGAVAADRIGQGVVGDAAHR
jgi:hypothetical protein